MLAQSKPFGRYYPKNIKHAIVEIFRKLDELIYFRWIFLDEFGKNCY